MLQLSKGHVFGSWLFAAAQQPCASCSYFVHPSTNSIIRYWCKRQKECGSLVVCHL